jgi:hypothetical protein
MEKGTQPARQNQERRRQIANRGLTRRLKDQVLLAMRKQANNRTEEWENLNAKGDQENDLAGELRGQNKS